MATTSDWARVRAVLNMCLSQRLLVGLQVEASEWVGSEVLRNRARNSLPVRKSIGGIYIDSRHSEKLFVEEDLILIFTLQTFFVWEF